MLERLGEVLRKATNKIANAIFLDKNLVDSIIKDLQRALIEADVSIQLIKKLSDKIKKSAYKNGDYHRVYFGEILSCYKNI